MRIDGISGAGIQPGTAGTGAGGQLDEVSKNLQNQIENLRKQMQELSSNQEMPMETKMKKRQEIQKQISELEIQMRQHQMEVKREERQEKQSKGPSMDEMLGAKKQEDSQSTGIGMSTGSMETLISAETSLKQASVHGSAAKEMEGKAGVLKAEIKLDQGRGGDTAAKEAELAKVNEAAQKMTASQMDSLSQATQILQEASKEEQNSTKKTDGENKTAVEMEQRVEDDMMKDSRDLQQEETSDNTYNVEIPGVPLSRGYHPVDVRM